MNHVVSVRAIESAAPGGRMGPYYRGDRLWSPGWHDHVVDDAVLALIEKDPWLDVRRLDPRSQAARKKQLAEIADAEAIAAETQAAVLRAKADVLLAEAEAELDAVGREPPPAPPPAPTPFKDALVAAMPDEVRRQIDLERAAPQAVQAAQVASQLVGSPAPPIPEFAPATPEPKPSKKR